MGTGRGRRWFHLSSGVSEDRGDCSQEGSLACVRRWNGTSWDGRAGGSVGEEERTGEGFWQRRALAGFEEWYLTEIK